MAYDAIIIGTGQAGPPLAVRMANEGMKIAIIERKLFGGTCVNTGCIPTKALVASAKAAYTVKHAQAFGTVITGDVHVDIKSVKKRKDKIANTANKNVEKWLHSTDNLTIYKGHARFIDDKHVTVNDETLSADKFFIDVGARAFVPPIEGLDEINPLDNASILDIDYLPEHLIIIGGSYIGLEFAQMYRRFGSKVTIIERDDRLINREDTDISNCIKDILEDEGIDIYLNAKCTAVKKQDNTITATLDCKDKSREIKGTDILIAVGRTPNTDDLGLNHAGVSTDERGFIQVDDELHTNIPHIFALGECNGKGAFTHTAYNDYEIVADNLFKGTARKVSDRILTYGLFTDPPLARVGMTEQQARDSKRNILIGKRPMSRVGRAIERSETQGFMKVLVDTDTKEILGAAILGMNSDEAIHCITDMMYAKKPYTVITHAVHIHPTVSELIPTILGELK